MKATGIVRRIDDLGRIVIPKEIRRTLRLKDGDALEIYTDTNGEVIFKKYSPVGELGDFIGTYAEVISKVGNFPVLISDRDHIVAAAGISKREFLERRITPSTEEFIENRKSYHFSEKQYPLQPVEGMDSQALLIYPIISSGDVTGSVIMLSTPEKHTPNDSDIKLIQSASIFLGKQTEE